MDGEQRPVSPGDVVFVAAEVPHKFVERGRPHAARCLRPRSRARSRRYRAGRSVRPALPLIYSRRRRALVPRSTMTRALIAGARAPDGGVAGSARDSVSNADWTPQRRRVAGFPVTRLNTEARRSGLLCSRPVSRILSGAIIHLGRRSLNGSSGAPGSSAGNLSGACLPCTGRGLASRRVTTALVSSYPTFSPLPSASLENADGGLLSVPLSVGFRRLGFPQRPALRCPDFPRAAPCETARDHPTCRRNCSPDLRRRP